MIRKVHLNEGQTVEINTSAGWLLIYRETFGKDILPDLMPIVEAVFTSLIEILEDADPESISRDGKIVVDTSSIIGSAMSGAFTNTIAALSTLEFTTIIQILWSLAKNADNKVPNDIASWINQFDTFPVDTITAELFSAISDSMISSKNVRRLKEMLQEIKLQSTSLSTKSSSELQPED